MFYCQLTELSTQVPEKEPWQIFVNTVIGKTITISSHPFATVRSLLYEIQEKDGLLLWDMRLIYGGKQLDRDRFLRDYGIQKGSTIHLVLRLSGGDSHSSNDRCP